MTTQTTYSPTYTTSQLSLARLLIETHETRHGTCPDCGSESDDCCAMCGSCGCEGPCGCAGRNNDQD